MTYRETDKCWHILVTTYGGLVSILQNLDAPTARQTYKTLDPWGRQSANQYQGGNYGMTIISNNDVKSLQVIGPEGESLFAPASCDTRPKGQDAKQGLAGTESGAVTEGETH